MLITLYTMFCLNSVTGGLREEILNFKNILSHRTKTYMMTNSKLF